MQQGLAFLLVFLNLRFQRVNAGGHRLLETVGLLADEEIGTGQAKLDFGNLVVVALRFVDFQRNFALCDIVNQAVEFRHLVDDELLQFGIRLEFLLPYLEFISPFMDDKLIFLR